MPQSLIQKSSPARETESWEPEPTKFQAQLQKTLEMLIAQEQTNQKFLEELLKHFEQIQKELNDRRKK